MSDVMDIMMKIGVTEEVTHVFESMSNLMKRVHDRAVGLRGSLFKGIEKFAGPKTRKRRSGRGPPQIL
jgi:hypothetical protein